MNKKKICIAITVLLLVLSGCFMNNKKEKTPQPAIDKMTIYIASDIHYISPELTDNGSFFTDLIESADGKAMQYIEEITDAFVDRMIVSKPDAVILSGDISFNGARESHEKLTEKLRKISDAGIQILVIPGNHDLYSKTAASFSGDGYTLVESIDADGFLEAYHSFGYDRALDRDENSLSYTYELGPEYLLLMVDVNTEKSPGKLTEETFDWVKAQLSAAKKSGKKVIAVSHQNVLAHNSIFIDGFVMGGYERLCSLYEEYGVLLNLSGHMHIQDIKTSDKGFTEVATSALSVSPFQFGILDIEGNALDYRTETLSFPHYEEAKQFMWDVSYRKAQEGLPEGTSELYEYIADLNTAYFSGHKDEIRWNDDIYKKVCKNNAFYGLYLKSIKDDGLVDENKFTF